VRAGADDQGNLAFEGHQLAAPRPDDRLIVAGQ
jgi:hypothetical protein